MTSVLSGPDCLELFRQSGALLDGHFRLSSGLHSERYLQSALVLQHPGFASALGEGIAARTRHLDPTVVLSPALGGIVIGQEVARALSVRDVSIGVRCKRPATRREARATSSGVTRSEPSAMPQPTPTSRSTRARSRPRAG